MIFKNSLFRRWFFLQLLFWCSMMLFIGIFFIYTSNSLDQQMEQLYAEKMLRLTRDIDMVITEAISEGTRFVINPVMQVMTTAGNHQEKYIDRENARLVDEIKQSNASNESVSEIILFFSERDTFITSSGVMDRQVFNEIYDGQEKMMADLVKDEDISGLRRVMNFSQYPDGERTGAIVLEMIGNHNKNSRVIILLNKETIEKLLKDYCQFNEEIVTVFLPDGQVIFTTKGQDKEDDYNRMTSDDSKYGVTISLDTPKHLFYRQKIQFQYLGFSAIAIAGLIGILLSFYITVLKVKPIHTIAVKSGEVSLQENGTGDLSQISEAINIAVENKQVMSVHASYIKDSSWRMIMKGELTIEEGTNYVKELLNVREDEYFFTFILVNNSEDIGNLKERVSTYISKKIPSYKQACILQEEDRVVVVLALGSQVDNKKTLAIIETKLSQTLLELSKDFQISIGPIGKASSGIHTSYQMALRQLNLSIVPDLKGRILSRNMMNEESGEMPNIITNEESVTFTSFIQGGNCKEAVNLLHDYMNKEHVGSFSAFAYKLRFYDLAGIVIQAAKFLEEKTLNDDLVKDFALGFENGSYEVLVKTLESAIEKVCRSYKEFKSSSNILLNQRLLDYIQIHLDEEQLSCESMADNMKMNQAYIRQFFREQNGIGFWDYVNIGRIDKVKRQLIHTNKSVRNISENCGYVSISTFSRAFKKQVGMTPGQFRKWSRLKENQDNMSK